MGNWEDALMDTNKDSFNYITPKVVGDSFDRYLFRIASFLDNKVKDLLVTWKMAQGLSILDVDKGVILSVTIDKEDDCFLIESFSHGSAIYGRFYFDSSIKNVVDKVSSLLS